MTRFLRIGTLALTLSFCLGGCGYTLESLIFNPTTTTLRLVNRTDFTVNARLFTSPVNNVSGSELSLIGTQRDYTLGTAQVLVVPLPCEELRSFIVATAQLDTPALPTTSTGNIRSAGVYDCGDTITISFDHPPNFSSLHVGVEIEPK